MEEPFNPYVVWFGITGAHRRPNHYALLGLSPFESDTVAIEAAARRRAADLAEVQPGAYEALRQQLLTEVEQARRVLADPAQKRQYDELLRRHAAAHASKTTTTQRSNASPESSKTKLNASVADLLPPRTATVAGPRLPTNNATADPMAPFAPQKHAAASTKLRSLVLAGGQQASSPTNPASPLKESEINGGPHAAVSDQLASARNAVRQLARRRSRAQHWLMAAILVLLTATVGGLGIGYATGWIRFGTTPSVVKGDPSVDTVGSKGAHDDDAGEQHSIENGSISENEASQPEIPTTGKQARSTQLRSTGDSANVKSTSVSPNDHSDSVKINDAAMSADSATASDLRSKAVDPPVDAAQAAKMRTELAAARKALGERKTDDAKQHIEAAKKLAASSEQKQLVAGFHLLAGRIEEFWKAVGEGLKSVEKAGELIVGNTPVSIVEVGAEQIVIRTNGENRRYPLDRLPAGLAVAIAKKWFDDRPENKVVLGAFYFVDPLADAAEAKRLWQEAAAAEVDVSHLLLLMPIAETSKDTSDVPTNGK